MSNFFLERYKRFGQDIDPLVIALSPSIRVNTLKISESELIKRFKDKGVVLKKVSELKYCYNLDKQDFSLASTPEYLQGFFYVQEVASQVPALVLDPRPGEVVLDMCAAPGSKTTQLAQLMNNEGSIVALDVKNDRLKVLGNNLERCGVENVLTYNKDARYVSDLGLKFDKVLLDAPCSGNFVIESDWFMIRDIGGIVENSVVQRSLLKSALSVLKPGGILVYSTCSLEPEEDELVIDWLLSNFDVKLEEISLKLGSEGLIKFENKVLSPELSKTRRFWPNLTHTQGFFVAKIRKL